MLELHECYLLQSFIFSFTAIKFIIVSQFKDGISDLISILVKRHLIKLQLC